MAHAAAAPKSKFTNKVAAVLSFLIPGLGQIYKGEALGGMAWFVFTLTGYCCLIVPGLVLHLFCIFSAGMD